jgi:hypothetical protein
MYSCFGGTAAAAIEERHARGARCQSRSQLQHTAAVTVIHFDPAVWLDRCAAAGMNVCWHNDSLWFGMHGADWDQVSPLLTQFTSVPGAKAAVFALVESRSRSEVS